MDEQRKRELVENYEYTWDGGVPCSVGGWKNRHAGVSPATGKSYGLTWEDLSRIADGNRDIPRRDCWLQSEIWLGYMTRQEADQCRAEWRLQQEEWERDCWRREANRRQAEELHITF